MSKEIQEVVTAEDAIRIAREACRQMARGAVLENMDDEVDSLMHQASFFAVEAGPEDYDA